MAQAAALESSDAAHQEQAEQLDAVGVAELAEGWPLAYRFQLLVASGAEVDEVEGAAQVAERPDSREGVRLVFERLALLGETAYQAYQEFQA